MISSLHLFSSGLRSKIRRTLAIPIRTLDQYETEFKRMKPRDMKALQTQYKEEILDLVDMIRSDEMAEALGQAYDTVLPIDRIKKLVGNVLGRHGDGFVWGFTVISRDSIPVSFPDLVTLIEPAISDLIQEEMESYERELERKRDYVPPKKLTLSKGRLNPKTTEWVRHMKPKAKSMGTLEDALMSAVFYAVKNGETMWVEPFSGAGAFGTVRTAWRVVREQKKLDSWYAILYQGQPVPIFSITPEREVYEHEMF